MLGTVPRERATAQVRFAVGARKIGRTSCRRKGVGLPYVLCLRGAVSSRRIARIGGGSGAENAGVYERKQPYFRGGNSACGYGTHAATAFRIGIQKI